MPTGYFEQAFLRAALRWGAALPGELGGPAELGPAGEWRRVSLAEWLAEGGSARAAACMELAWADRAGLGLLTASRDGLAELAAGAGSAPEGEGERWQKPLDALLRSLVAALNETFASARGAVSCAPVWTLPSADPREVACAGADCLPDEARACRIECRIPGRAEPISLDLALPAELWELEEAEATAPPDEPVVAVLAFDTRMRREIRLAAEMVHPSVVDFADLRLYMQSDSAARTHLLILALSIENRTALEQCRALKSDPSLKAVPILMCAPTATRDLFIAAMAAGAEGFAVTPFEASVPAQLRRILPAA